MRKLFWDDPYVASATARVTRIQGREIWLDQTIIYSLSGGQESDSGTIGGHNVTASRIAPDGTIVYSLEREALLSVGLDVELRIDWERRYRIMRLHSATHIALALFSDLVGESERCGANVSDRKGRLDFERDEPISPIVPELQRQMDAIVKEDLEIQVRPDQSLGLAEGRLWTIGGKSRFWTMGCGGTHPRRTGEVGVVRLKRDNIGRGKERLEIRLL